MKNTKSSFRSTNFVTRTVSMLLAFIMVLSVFTIIPTVEADAATAPTVYSQLSDKAAFNYPGGSGSTYKSSGCGVYSLVNAVKYLTGSKIDPHQLGTFAIKNGARVNGGVRGQVLCKKAAADSQFGGKYGFELSETYTFGSYDRSMTCKIGSKVTSRYYPSKNEWKTLYSKLVSHLNAGDVAVVLVLGHYMAIVDYDSKTDRFLMLDSAAYTKKRLTQNSGKYQWVTADMLNFNKAKSANSSYTNQGPYIHLRQEVMFLSKKNPNYKVTSATCTGVTNKSANIKVTLNTTATVRKWTYYLSKNKSAVNNVNGEDGSTHHNTSDMHCCRIKDYMSSPKTLSSDTFTINKLFNDPLTPNTTYYYRVTAYIGSKWYQSSMGSFTTAQVKPGSTKVRVASSSQTLGIGDQPTVLWDAASGADSYTITVKDPSGKVVQTKSGVKGTTCVLNSVATSGTYTVGISAVNGAGSTTGTSASFVVKPNVKVTFYDTISKKAIETKTVSWGHGTTAPKGPKHEGHTFSKWDRPYDKVTSDITVNTVYGVNSYTVKFVDSFTNKVLKTQTVKYKESATAPNATPPEEGYALVGWTKDISCVKEDMTVYTIYKWADKDHSTTITVNSVKRNNTKVGYDVNVTVKNHVAEITSGRVVVALRSEKGVLLTTNESSAFAMDSGESRTMTITVLCAELAPIADVHVVNSYESLGKIAKTVRYYIDNSSSTEWSSWITYTGTCPMESRDGVTVETRTLTETIPTKYYYRYKTKETGTSYNTSVAGWTQNGYTLVKSSTGTLSYVSSWPSGFDKSHHLYKENNNTPKSASENATQKVVIESTVNNGYIYWHWCRGGNYGAIDRAIGWSKGGDKDTFHAFYSREAKSYSASANAVKFKNTDKCKDTHWWNTIKSGSSSLLTVKKQTYTVYNKLYNYYRYSGFSNWIEYTGSVPIYNGQSAGTNKTYQNIETTSVAGSTKYTYQYRYMTSTNPTVAEPELSKEQICKISANVGLINAGKVATVWVYKFDQASDYTTEYVGFPTLSDDGSFEIDAYLREAPSVESGDYTIAVSVPGQQSAVEIGKIEAPKPKYTVTFKDFDGTVISEQTVVEGDNAELPSEELLHVPEGYRFTNWSESVINVRSDLEILPEKETEKFVVAFVNWEVQSVELVEYYYGAELVANGLPDGKEGYVTEWVVQVEDKYLTIEEYTAAGHKVTGHMVVETRSTPEKFNITFVDANPETKLDEEKIEKENVDIAEVASQNQAEYGTNIDFSEVQTEIEENPDYIFYGWVNAYTGEPLEDTTVKGDVVLYPSYDFVETTETPIADVETGEYAQVQAVTLSSATEDATIWYTTDGTDPMNSETAVEYTGPVAITESCILRTYAGSLSRNDSGESTYVYAINTPDNTKYHVVSIWSLFDDSNGDEASIGLVKDGAYLSTSLFTQIEGYTFDTLYFDAECNEEFFYKDETVTGSLELFANYTPNKYVVKFVDFDGTVIAEQEVEYGNSAIAPNVPNRDGYVFSGWDAGFDCILTDSVITAKYLDESEYAEVSLNRTRALNIAQNTTFTSLKAIITPEIHNDYEIIWASDNELVAGVDENGHISALNAGTATITATLPYTGSSASIVVNVTVNPDYVLVLKESSTMGFDSDRNLRAVPVDKNTVEEIRGHFENKDLVFCDAEGNVLTETDKVCTGTVIKLMDGETTLDSTTAVLTGDFNGDGYINNKDVVMINQYVLEKRTANEIQMIAIDVNGDGFVNNRDCAMLARYLVGKETL